MDWKKLKESNDNWKFWIAVIIVIGFAAMIFALFKRNKHFAISYDTAMETARSRREEIDFKFRQLERMIRDCEDDGHQIDLLRDCARKVRSGWILNGGFVEKETPNTQTLISYDMIGEINAGNVLARRSLEDMRPTEGQYEGHRVMLEAANQGAIPSEGPLIQAFRPGNRELSMTAEHEKEQAIQMCGRLELKMAQLDRRLELLLEVERERERYEHLLEVAEERRSLR